MNIVMWVFLFTALTTYLLRRKHIRNVQDVTARRLRRILREEE